MFTDLAGPAPPGLSFSASVDTRYSSSPTPLKMAAMILGVALTGAALVALHILDTADGMRHRRFLPARWWSTGGLDTLVIAVLVWWHFVGANTSDDGYILTMARVSEHAGYMANYYRWFGTPEAPSAGTTTCWRCGLMSARPVSGCAYPPWRWRSPAGG